MYRIYLDMISWNFFMKWYFIFVFKFFCVVCAFNYNTFNKLLSLNLFLNVRQFLSKILYQNICEIYRLRRYEFTAYFESHIFQCFMKKRIRE